MTTPTLAFIGAGNMALSLIGGLIASGYDPDRLIASDPDTERCQSIGQRYGIACVSDNHQAVLQADMVVLAVKPQQLPEVCQALQPTLKTVTPLIVSIAAGVRSDDINRWLGDGQAIVRAMPNTPSLIQTGASALYANAQVTAAQKDMAEHLMRSAGLTLWVDQETDLDTVTAVSGSGPAYYFLFMELMEKAAQSLGLDAKTAHLLTIQTAFGASKMALESADSCQTLREKVTSPNGTTEQALAVFNQHHLDDTLLEAMQAARKRAQTLADEFGQA